MRAISAARSRAGAGTGANAGAACGVDVGGGGEGARGGPAAILPAGVIIAFHVRKAFQGLGQIVAGLYRIRSDIS